MEATLTEGITTSEILMETIIMNINCRCTFHVIFLHISFVWTYSCYLSEHLLSVQLETGQLTLAVAMVDCTTAEQANTLSEKRAK